MTRVMRLTWSGLLNFVGTRPEMYAGLLPKNDLKCRTFRLQEGIRPVNTGVYISGQLWECLASGVQYMVIGKNHIQELVVIVVDAPGQCIGMLRKGRPGKNFFLDRPIFR
ncbi:MAG: hypothetical protein Q7T51_03030 [Candidatus Moranbacteria bacterium]|nr:hypothetical protein [Candidatus Moranbacteria bacterium]